MCRTAVGQTAADGSVCVVLYIYTTTRLQIKLHEQINDYRRLNQLFIRQPAESENKTIFNKPTRPRNELLHVTAR